MVHLGPCCTAWRERNMRYPANTWIEVVVTRLKEVAEVWFNGES